MVRAAAATAGAMEGAVEEVMVPKVDMVVRAASTVRTAVGRWVARVAVAELPRRRRRL